MKAFFLLHKIISYFKSQIINDEKPTHLAIDSLELYRLRTN